MPFKYAYDLERLACNLNHYSERENRDAYCWVHWDINHPKNFLPRAILVNRTEKCEEWSLSFFEQAIQARNRMKALMSNKPNLPKILGEHVAYGVLVEQDGVSEACDSSGHFNHHEYLNVDFKKKFNIIGTSF